MRKDTQPGIEVHYEWSDQDLIRVTVYASNGAFCGTSSVYIGHGRLSAMAKELAGFPVDVNDKRSITFGRTSASGGVSMSFRCTDRSGHAVAEVVMESEDGVQSVNLMVPVGSSAVDEFVKGLVQIESARGRAVLPQFNLQTR